MNVEFKYPIGDEVKLVAIGMLGRVDSMSMDMNGLQYRAVYWNDGGRYSTWMYDWELKEVK